MKRCRIIFSGSGGQGIITAARILAEAAAIHEGLNAVQSQSYGPEARGSSCHSEVIISDYDILFPKVTQPNVVVSLTQASYNEFSSLIRPGGLLLTDSYYVKQEINLDVKQIELEMYTTVIDKIGMPIVFNICVLGALINLIPLIKKGSIEKVLEEHYKANLLDFNMQAMELGWNLAEKFKKKRGIQSFQLW